MPKQKPFDKKTATTYALVHRPQNDPLINDSDAPSQILTEIAGPARGYKVRRRDDLESEYGYSGSVRDNEGEAAEHGIFYDDSSYDYMQHMRDLGGSTEATWVEAKSAKAKGKQNLEDALRELDVSDTQSLGGQSYGGQSHGGQSYGGQSYGGQSYGGYSFSGQGSSKALYQSQQDVPDELQGFQPDMDPRLREVLEALDDEAYVEDDDDIFLELADGVEVSKDEFETTPFEDDDGWVSDHTERPVNRESHDNDTFDIPPQSQDDNIPQTSIPDTTAEDGKWLQEFAKSKAAVTARDGPKKLEASIQTASTQLGRRKKRKGALTSTSSYSMTSSVLARTEALSTLDARFDKIAESYMEDDFDDEASLASGVTGMTGMTGLSKASRASKYSAWGGSQASEAPSLVPTNFDNVLDDFLGGSEKGVKYRPMKKAGYQGRWAKGQGIKQLDEIRSGLGPAKIRSQ